jgi:hypothetical protein
MNRMAEWASPIMVGSLRRLALLGIVSSLCCTQPTLLAQQEESAGRPTAPEDLLKQSLPLRTALHHDPSLAAPLDRLLTMYRSAGQLKELVELYEGHTRQFPNDQNGLIVFIRLKAATGDPETLRMARSAVTRFGKNAYLRYLLFDILRRRHAPKALAHLDQAIQLQPLPNRRLAWIDELLTAAVAADRRDLAEKHLKTLTADATTAEARLELARKMNRYEFFDLALEQLNAPANDAISPEVMVATQLEAANSEVGLDRAKDAASRLDKLLQKLTADYWQRGEIIRRRLALIDTQAEREAIIAAARKDIERNPRGEAAILDLAQILAALQLRRDALTLLVEASKRLPKSESIERRTLEMFDRLRDERGRAKFLAERLKLQPARADLAVQQIKTLYELGHRDDARKALDGLAKKLDVDNRIKTILEMARFLRRSSMITDAAELFRDLISDAPDRIDIRRELAETYLALGQPGRIRPLFAGKISDGASLEDVLDLIQFMIQHELYVEARSALEQRLKQEGESLELQLLLLSIERRLGNIRAGERLIDDSRELADTAARYRMWLEAAVQFHDQFETVENLLVEEESRIELDPAKWTTRRLQRRLAYAEVCADNGRLDAALVMLQNDLADELPADFRVKLRRAMIGLLEKQPQLIAQLTDQLKLLGEEDGRFIDEATARLALLHSRAQRADLITPLLAKINLSNIQDASLLSSLEAIYRQQGRTVDVLFILGRLTELNPTDRSNWQRWLTSLAGTGDESRLRGALRQLLLGVQKMPLDETTKALLESHLADSYWRTIARRLAIDTDASVAQSLVPLDAVERMAQDDRQWLWVTWTRAFVLNRLQRGEPRDEAIGELERIVKLIYERAGNESPERLQIALPDGMTIDLQHARRLLVEPARRQTPSRPAASDGPLAPFAMLWKFDIGNANVHALDVIDDDRLLVSSSRGDLHCVNRVTGKLLWTLNNVVSTIPMALVQQYGHSDAVPSPGPSRPLVDGNGKIFVGSVSEVTCYSDTNGALLWQADVGATSAAAPSTGSAHVLLFRYREQLITFEPVSGTITRIDPVTGKIVWDMTVTTEAPSHIGWHNSGASLSGDWLMVYGRQAAVVDLKSENILWSFEPWRVRKFPIELNEPDNENSDSAASQAQVTAVNSGHTHHHIHSGLVHARSWSGPSLGMSPRSYYGLNPNPSQPQQVQFASFLAPANQAAVQSANPQYNLTLSSPAVVWSALARQGSHRSAELIGRTLLLRDQSGIQIVHTDLPLSGKRISVAGTFLGTSGRTACFAAPGQLYFVDTVTGNVRNNGPGANTRPGFAAPAQAALSGPLVYTSSSHGILCVNALTGQTVFTSDWPKELLQQIEPADKRPAGLPPGTLGYQPVGPFSAPSGRVISRFATSPQQMPMPAGQQRISPTISKVHGGILYTLISPTEVIALKGAGAANGN